MDIQRIDPPDRELLDRAKAIIAQRQSKISSVGCALRTTTGKVFEGVNLDSIHSGPCSSCAEFSAIGTMHTEGDYEIESIVAVLSDGIILPPCGRCRELIRQFGNPYVILQQDGQPIKVRLDELIPHWRSEAAWDT